MSRKHRPGGVSFSFSFFELTAAGSGDDMVDALKYALGVDLGGRDRTARVTLGKNGKPVIDVDSVEVAPPPRALTRRRR